MSRYVRDTGHRRSFEAAHAMLLALLTMASESLEWNRSELAFVDELAVYYASLLLQVGHPPVCVFL
jgi:hypothetical protein